MVLPPQILHRVDGIAALYNVKHTQGVDGQHLHAALGVVIEDGSQIAGTAAASVVPWARAVETSSVAAVMLK